METTAFERAVSWKQMYFVGISSSVRNTLSESQVQALCAMVNTPCVISTGAALDPLHLINHKGTTAWLLLFVQIFVSDKESLKDVSERKCSMFVPSDQVHNTFGGHINWPKSMVEKYSFQIEGYNFFIIPFLIYKDVEPAVNLQQSLKTPDGKMEIFGVREFNEANPESLLKDLCDLKEFILRERPDAVLKRKSIFSRIFGE